MADQQKKKAAKKTGTKRPRNEMLSCGVMRFSRARMFQKLGVYKKKKFAPVKKQKTVAVTTKVKQIGGDKNGGQRTVHLKKEPRALGSERTVKDRRPRNKKPFSHHRRRLRSSITPGTVLILLAGRHKGKRVIFLKQLATGLLLVTGPMKINNCPLRRINQIFVIATKTKIDISGIKIPDTLNDEYFRRAKKDRRKKTTGQDANIFTEKQEGYTVSDQRKKDQAALDKDILGVIRKHKDKKFLFGYLGSTFSLRKNEFPHRMVF